MNLSPLIKFKPQIDGAGPEPTIVFMMAYYYISSKGYSQAKAVEVVSKYLDELTEECSK